MVLSFVRSASTALPRKKIIRFIPVSPSSTHSSLTRYNCPLLLPPLSPPPPSPLEGLNPSSNEQAPTELLPPASSGPTPLRLLPWRRKLHHQPPVKVHCHSRSWRLSAMARAHVSEGLPFRGAAKLAGSGRARPEEAGAADDKQRAGDEAAICPMGIECRGKTPSQSLSLRSPCMPFSDRLVVYISLSCCSKFSKLLYEVFDFVVTFFSNVAIRDIYCT